MKDKRLILWMAAAIYAANLSPLRAQEKILFDISAQSLSSALEAFANQSGSQMLYSSDLLPSGSKSPTLKGEYSKAAALKRILENSGLEAKESNAGVFTLGKSVSPKVVSLEAITVSATRTPNKAFDLPLSATVLDKEQIDNLQPSDLAGIMRDIPGITLGSSSRQGAQIPTIRGYQGPQIVLRVDDARRSLDTSVGLFTPLYLDYNFLKQVEVVRGPASATHGGGGLGGVMAFQTIDAEDIIAPGHDLGVKSRSGWRSGDGSRTTNLTTAAQYEGTSLLAGGTIKKYNNINNGADTENVQNGTTKSSLIKLAHAMDPNNRVQLSYMRYDDEIFEPTNPNSNDQATTGFQKKERSQDEVVGKWIFKDNESQWFDGKVSLYFTDLKLDSRKRWAGTFGNDSMYNVTTEGFVTQNTSRFETFGLGNRFTYGLDGYQDILKNTGSGASSTVNRNGEMLAWGGFIQDEITLAKDWAMIGTLRYDSYKADSPDYPNNDNDRFSPKMAIKWQALEPLGFFASYGQAFRAPTLTELYQDFRGTGFSNFWKNPDLQPEVSRNMEVGMTLAFNNVLKDKDAFRLKANWFDEKVKNLINSTVMGKNGLATIYKYLNVPHAVRFGGELESNYRIDDWDLKLGYSRVRVVDTDSANNLFSPPDKLAFGANYYLDDNWRLRYNGRYVFSQQYDTTETRRRKDYDVHDIGAAYEKDWYKLDLSITNLFDRAYAEYHQSLSTSYNYLEGRSFNLFFTMKY